MNELMRSSDSLPAPSEADIAILSAWGEQRAIMIKTNGGTSNSTPAVTNSLLDTELTLLLHALGEIGAKEAEQKAKRALHTMCRDLDLFVLVTVVAFVGVGGFLAVKHVGAWFIVATTMAVGGYLEWTKYQQIRSAMRQFHASMRHVGESARDWIARRDGEAPPP